MKILYIINPVSGKKKGKEIGALAEVKSRLTGTILEFRYTEYPGHAIRLAKDTDADIVVAVGGDGTVNEVASGIVGTNKALGIIPTGSGNGLALHLGISRDVKKALKQLAREEYREIDCGSINGHPFFCSCGVGLDAEVSAAFASSEKRGLGTYIREALRIWKNYTPKHYHLLLDETEVELDAVLITVGNANQWGNNAYICPQANIGDGLLDVTILKPFRTIAAPGLIIRLMTGRLDRSKFVECIHAKNIKIIRDNAGWAHHDGECIEMGKEIDISVASQKLKVVC